MVEELGRDVLGLLRQRCLQAHAINKEQSGSHLVRADVLDSLRGLDVLVDRLAILLDGVLLVVVLDQELLQVH